MATSLHPAATQSDQVQHIAGVMPVQPNFVFGLFSASNSGKSVQALTFINNFDLFYPNVTVRRVVVVAPHFHHSSVAEKYGRDRVHHFTTFNNPLLFQLLRDGQGSEGVTLLLLDDVCNELQRSEEFVRLICVDTHHENICTIVCAHNIYQYPNNNWRTFTRNLNLIGLGNSVMQRQSAGILFQQIFGSGGSKKASVLLADAENIQRQRWDNAYWFLYLNLTPQCCFEHRIFTQPFSNLPIVYKFSN